MAQKVQGSSSQISYVTVYARGALVTRRVIPPKNLPPGEVELVISDITPLAEAGSLRASISGLRGSESGRQIVAVRSALYVPEVTAEPGPSLERVQTLSAKLGRAQAEVERLVKKRQQLAKSIPDPALRTTSLVEKIEERIADTLATAELLQATQLRIDARLSELEREIADLKHELAAAELAHSQSRSQLGPGHPTRRAIIHLSASENGSGAVEELALSYVVPAARFWPIYTLRMTDSREAGNAGRRATWMIEALVAQRSGEDWREVKLSLSTADLLLDARLPELPSLRLGRAQPPARRGYRPPPAGLDELFVTYDRAFRGAQTTVTESPPDDVGEYGGDSEEILESTAPAAEAADGAFDMRFSEAAPAKKKVGRGAPPAPGAPSPKSAPAMVMSLGRPPETGAAFGGGGPPRDMPSLSAAMPPPAPIMPEPQRARAPMRNSAMKDYARREQTTISQGYNGLYGGLSDDEGGQGGVSPFVEPQDNWLDFDRLNIAGPEDRARRGRLFRTSESLNLAGEKLAQQHRENLEAMEPADGVRDPLSSRGHFDHRYDTEGLVLVPTDGLAHRVMILSAETQPTLRLLTVPRERPEVYREAELKNPTEAPLLAGPVDVYVEGSLLTTAAIAAIDRGGALNVGMGVEERVRVARNVRSDEENVGLLGGTTQLNSHVSIELASALSQQCVVEVFERLPISDDKSVTIELLTSRPEPKEYTQAERGLPIRGGLIWRLLLPAGGKAKIEYQYRVIFPAKTEIVGGNRRD